MSRNYKLHNPAVYTLKEAIEIHQTISGSVIEIVKFYKFKPNGKK